MLAQSFKTAVDLEITDEQHAALVKTLALMEAGPIVHLDDKGKKKKGTYRFHMNSWPTDEAASCGTAACIGGTAEILTGVNFQRSGRPKQLHALFYPHIISDWTKITVALGAQALRNYLETGRSQWARVIPDTTGYEHEQLYRRERDDYL